MSCTHPRGAARRHSLLRGYPAAALILAAGLVLAGPSRADISTVHVVKLLTPTIEIESDGEVYTKPAIALTPVAASVNLHLDAQVSGAIKNYKVWLKFRTQTSDWAEFPQHAASESFPFGERPKALNSDLYVSIPYGSHASYLVSYCNLQANALRHGGLSDQEIFAQDRPIEVGILAGLQYEMSGVNGTVSTNALGTAWDVLKKLTVICKAKDPERVPAPPPTADNDPTRDKPEVLNATLAILEQHSFQGACTVNLSGVIRTSEPNTEVKFRYRSDDDKESELKTVTTDHTSTAMFSHEYPLSPGGVRSGQLRIVGTSSSFASPWQVYSVNCGPAAQGYASNDPSAPDLTLDVFPVDEKLYKGFVCPAKAALDTRILANDPMEGRAIHIAAQQGLIVEPQQQVSEMNFKVVKGQNFAAGASFDLKWSNVPVVGGNPPKQTMKFTFQAARHHTVIAQTEKTVVLSCRQVRTSGVGQGAPGGVAAGTPVPLPSQQAAVGQFAQPQGFAIQAPQGLARSGEIRLTGGAANGKYKLTFLRKSGGGYTAVQSAQLPKQMTGLVAGFPLQALTGGRDWRLEVCPLGGTAAGCKTADFRLTRIGGAGAASAPAAQEPQGTVVIFPGAAN